MKYLSDITGMPPMEIVFFTAASAMTLFLVLTNLCAEMVVFGVGTFYPAWKSVIAVEKNDAKESKQWYKDSKHSCKLG
jgi:hypothetical protein